MFVYLFHCSIHCWCFYAPVYAWSELNVLLNVPTRCYDKIAIVGVSIIYTDVIEQKKKHFTASMHDKTICEMKL